MALNSNITRNAEALKQKAAVGRQAAQDKAAADDAYQQDIEYLQRRAADLGRWREEQRALQQAAMDAYMAQVDAAVDAEMLRRFPGELAQAAADRDARYAAADALVAQQEAHYQQLIAEMARERARPQIEALRERRALAVVMTELQPHDYPTVAAWEEQWAIKEHKRLRRALRLIDGAPLPPDVEAALTPSEEQVAHQRWVQSLPVDHNGEPVMPRTEPLQVPAPLPVPLRPVDPAVMARIDELLGPGG